MTEDFNKLRMIASTLVHTEFQEPWQFQLRFDDKSAPEDMDIYIKDITYGPIEIQTEEVKAGIQTLTFPIGTGPVGVSMTVRDNQDRRIYKWFAAWCDAMVNADGTVNLPNAYVRKVERINLVDDSVQDAWFMFPTQLGDITESVDAEGFLEFPMSFIQFRSWGE